MRACTISSSVFDMGEQYLAVSSSTGTVHVFAIGDTEESGLFGGFANYLSHSLTLSKSIARLHLSDSECKWTTKGSAFVGPMVTFSREEAKLYIITPGGSLLHAAFNAHTGADLVTHRVINWLHEDTKQESYNPFASELDEESLVRTCLEGELRCEIGEGSSGAEVEAGNSRVSTFQSTPKFIKKETDDWLIIE
eukprot:TRINITY_DN7737_c0_g2_i8.p1 TRINITY_DN7737_c0_g2~~TRINITY_DN7737_c0_g2_i8.p1  ORF type:complete len:194 (+),score=32.25 TRINITY_DN7737_c0_g2_i8:724-1305(+)